MIPSHFWKTLPAPIQWLRRPWLIVSLTLHGILILLPVAPDEAELDALGNAVQPETQIRVTQLAPRPSVPVLRSPPPSPSLSASPLPASSKPPSPPVPPPATPRPPRLTSEPTPIASPLPPSPSSPSPSPTPTLPNEQTHESTDGLEPESPGSPTPSASPTSDSTISTDSPLATFPHLAGAQPGCNGREDCWQTTDTQWRAIARTFEQDLQNQNYDVDELNLAMDTGMRVYQVSKNGETQYYLNLISTLNGTIYLISTHQLTPAELSQLAGL